MKKPAGARTWEVARIACLAVIATFSVTACVAEVDTSQSFEGPWAAEFSEHFALAEDDFTREVLSDGKISEQELSETLERFHGCLEKYSIVLSDYDSDGSFRTSFPPGMSNDKANEATKACSRESGEHLIGSLYTWTHNNPQGEDETKLVADCLVKSGAVPSGYTSSEYLDNVVTDSFPFTDATSGRELLETCRTDPLGLQSDR